MLSNKQMNDLLIDLIKLIEIPPSYYQLARDRYDSLGRFLDESPVLAGFNPQVYPQGSFQYGTVIRPILVTEEYDLDLVCQIEATKAAYTQRQIKHLIGGEIKRYAKENDFKSPAKEKKRCWRLDYADDVSFHMDILPAIPESVALIQAFVAAGVEPQFAMHAVSITDKEDEAYNTLCDRWPSSNPRGFARWFESKMAANAEPVRKQLVLEGAYATVDEVPAYKWKTTLQRCIQLLKRHRDVMFKDSTDVKPISMIITTLAARSYCGESNLYEALATILDAMPKLVSTSDPRVPNPVDPAEDFADKWKHDDRLETNFRLWCQRAKSDFESLRFLGMADLKGRISEDLNIEYDVNSTIATGIVGAAASQQSARPKAVNITSPSRPWGQHRN